MTYAVEDLVRAHMDQRLAEAESRRVVGELRKSRRRQRHEPRMARKAGCRRTPLLDSTTQRRPMSLAGLLALTAERVAAEGTRSETRIIEATARAARWTAPCASTALVDWDGSEIARQRAFGIVHGVVLDLPVSAARRQLLGEIVGLTAASPGRLTEPSGWSGEPVDAHPVEQGDPTTAVL